MPIKLNAKVCLEMGGHPINDEDCRVTKEFIINLASKLTLTGIGQTYLNGLTRIRGDDEKAIAVQGIYIGINSDTETKEQHKAQYILSHLSLNKPLPVYKPKKNAMTESELEHIMLTFESWTENKIRKMPSEEDIESLEDSDVFKCSGGKNELKMPQKACFHMTDFEYKIFKALNDKTKEKIKKLATENIVVDSWGINGVPSSTQNSKNGILYSYSDEVTEHCAKVHPQSHINYKMSPEAITESHIRFDACKIESTVNGQIDGKPYEDVEKGEDWRFNKIREKMMEEQFHVMSDGKLMSKEEANMEVKKLMMQRENSKLSLKDYTDFANFKGYPVDKVLVANPWGHDVLKQEVIDAKEKANKRIKIIEE